MWKFINPHNKESKDIMPSCDHSLIVFFVHSRCESCYSYSISNKSGDVIVLHYLEELNFLMAASFWYN